MKGANKMKKSNFIALVLGIASGMLFALGMCMALLPEWNAFTAGIIFGALGLILALVTVLIWYRMEGKKLPKISVKHLLWTLYGIAGVLVLGAGLCMCLVWQNFVWGTIVGLIGMLMLVGLIPMIKGLK